MELISGRSNLLVKQIRLLRQKKGRDESGLFLVEGIHHVGEAAEAGWDLERLVYAPDLLTSDFGLRLVDEQSRRGVHCAALTRDLFAELAEKDNPQGILALVRQRHLTLETLISSPQGTPENFRFGVAVVSPQDPGNVGTILRTLDAVGADGLILLDSLTGAGSGVDPYHPSVVRASMGAIFWKPLAQASFDDFMKWVRKYGYQLVGSSAHAQTDYWDFKRGDQPTILLLGSEQKGLTQEQMATCDVTLSIPMKGRASSLNLAVAAGILLYAMMGNK
jgi:RNA methyltransferase, TrmH family